MKKLKPYAPDVLAGLGIILLYAISDSLFRWLESGLVWLWLMSFLTRHVSWEKRRAFLQDEYTRVFAWASYVLGVGGAFWFTMDLVLWGFRTGLPPAFLREATLAALWGGMVWLSVWIVGEGEPVEPPRFTRKDLRLLWRPGSLRIVEPKPDRPETEMEARPGSGDTEVH